VPMVYLRSDNRVMLFPLRLCRPGFPEHSMESHRLKRRCLDPGKRTWSALD
jgi:hypothetical protein